MIGEALSPFVRLKDLDPFSYWSIVKAEGTVWQCGGVMNLSEDLPEILKVLVIDPLLVTVKMAETLATLGLKHSKARFYHAPRRKE